MFSRETKEKISYWGAKLECPVDEDANYENTYVSNFLKLKLFYVIMHGSGAIAILSQSPKIGGPGHGKALLDTGLLQEPIIQHGQQGQLC